MFFLPLAVVEEWAVLKMEQVVEEARRQGEWAWHVTWLEDYKLFLTAFIS